MKHVNTLEIYDELMAKGFSEVQARAQTEILENSFKAVYEDFKDTFASNKLITIIGTIIIAIGGFTLNKVWDLSHDIIEVKSRLGYLEEKFK